MTLILSQNLHAKPCCDLVAITSELPFDIFICINQKTVNSKDLLAIMSLNARKGQEIMLEFPNSVLKAEQDNILSILEKIL